MLKGFKDFYTRTHLYFEKDIWVILEFLSPARIKMIIYRVPYIQSVADKTIQSRYLDYLKR